MESRMFHASKAAGYRINPGYRRRWRGECKLYSNKSRRRRRRDSLNYCLTESRLTGTLIGCSVSELQNQTYMPKSKVKPSVVKLAPARAGRSANPLPATASKARVSKLKATSQRPGRTAQAAPAPKDASGSVAKTDNGSIKTKSGADLTEN